MKALFFLLLIALTQQARFSQSLTQWTFRFEGASRDYPATIPSTLAWDLIENKVVSSDPYYRDNFLQFYQFETKDASYRTTFNISAPLLASKHQLLVFEGLDTHAEVFLNGQRILTANNMFRRWEVEVKFNRTNELVVNFTASTKHDLEQERIFRETYGFGLPANYSFTRKAAYQYGWDWGPRILSVGIWKEVYAVLYNDTRLDNLRFTHSEINKTIRSISCQVGLDVSQLDQLASYTLSLQVKRKANNIPIYETALPIKSTTSTSLSLPFNITSNIWDNVWWTWDLGQPNLIVVSVKLVNLNSLQSVESSITTGIRSVSVVQEFSKTYNGTSFTFNLNGYDVYMRGGNYIPPEMSMARTSRSTYERIKKDALFGRFNMLRLWGGGQFEKDQFYESMDEAGILIWHDLMFACALYPSSPQILSNIEAEMRDNVKRLRHHPSIGLWNGNNEVWIGWQEWGWQKGLTEAQKKEVETMYNDVFKGVLPKVLKEEHPEVYYWETSPSVSSSTTKSINSGDIHFWRVWAAGAPIEEYEEYVGRFNSEYGMQAMPEMSSLQRFTRPQDLDYPSSNDSYVMRLHERHPSGHILLPGYTFNYSCPSGNTTRISYFSQVMQSYALETAITSLRLNKPYNMGSLYWQLNDVWPVTSWATVDYYGTYKAAHYTVRSVYEQLIMHTIHEKSSGDYVTYVVNDYNRTFSCHCQLAIISFSGEATKVKHTVEKTVKPFERALIHRFNKTQYSNFTTTGFIRMDLRTLDNVVSSHNYFFVPMIKRTNAVPELTYSLQGSSLTVSTKKIATYVWIYRKVNDNYLPLQLSDNYFTLIPGESRTIDVGDTPHGEIYVTCFEIEFNSEKRARASLVVEE